MTKRRLRYYDIRIAPSIYVDSMCHYHAWIFFGDQKLEKHCSREYCWDIVDPLGFQAPKYLEAECKRLFLATLQDPETRYYEYDRDGNKRYSGLRYYDPADVARIIGALETDAERERPDGA